MARHLDNAKFEVSLFSVYDLIIPLRFRCSEKILPIIFQNTKLLEHVIVKTKNFFFQFEHTFFSEFNTGSGHKRHISHTWFTHSEHLSL